MKLTGKSPRRVFCLVFAVGLVTYVGSYRAAGQQGQEVLNNESIISMVQAHVEDSLIVTQIQNSPGRYNLTANGLIQLVQHGVPKSVISAMQGKAAQAGPNDRSSGGPAPRNQIGAGGPNDSPELLKRWVYSDPKRDASGGFQYSGSASGLAERLRLFLDKNGSDYWKIPEHTFDREADYIAKVIELCSSITPDLAATIGVGNVSIGDPEYRVCGQFEPDRNVTEKFRAFNNNRERGITLRFDERLAWRFRYSQMNAIVRFTIIPSQPAAYWDDETRARNAHEQSYFPAHSEVVNASIDFAPLPPDRAVALSKEINDMDTSFAQSAPSAFGQASQLETQGALRSPMPVASTSTQVAVISSKAAMSLVEQKVDPEYSPLQRAAHVTGTVLLEATVSALGTLTNLTIVGGPAMLQQSAMSAVKKWTFRPYVLNGVQTPFKAVIQVPFPPGG